MTGTLAPTQSRSPKDRRAAAGIVTAPSNGFVQRPNLLRQPSWAIAGPRRTGSTMMTNASIIV